LVRGGRTCWTPPGRRDDRDARNQREPGRTGLRGPRPLVAVRDAALRVEHDELPATLAAIAGANASTARSIPRSTGTWPIVRSAQPSPGTANRCADASARGSRLARRNAFTSTGGSAREMWPQSQATDLSRHVLDASGN
jgi:hypothetical protein